MVWIRRVRTASGATAVQIAESVDGRRRIVRHVGSARDDAELGLLIEEARRLLADDSQGELDLGITPKTVRAHMVAPPGQTLFPDQPMPRQLVVRPQVLKSSKAELKADKKTDFLDELIMPRAIAMVEGGVLVSEPPTLWYCQDTDGERLGRVVVTVERGPVDPGGTAEPGDGEPVEVLAAEPC